MCSEWLEYFKELPVCVCVWWLNKLWFRWEELVAGTTSRVVMLLLYSLSDVNLDFYSQICAFLQWLASKTISRPGMEAVDLQRVQAEGSAGNRAPRADRGCISKQWPKEPGQWPYTTRYRSNRTVSQSTDPFSSSAKIISFGNMQRK